MWSYKTVQAAKQINWPSSLLKRSAAKSFKRPRGSLIILYNSKNCNVKFNQGPYTYKVKLYERVIHHHESINNYFFGSIYINNNARNNWHAFPHICCVMTEFDAAELIGRNMDTRSSVHKEIKSRWDSPPPVYFQYSSQLGIRD